MRYCLHIPLTDHLRHTPARHPIFTCATLVHFMAATSSAEESLANVDIEVATDAISVAAIAVAQLRKTGSANLSLNAAVRGFVI